MELVLEIVQTVALAAIAGMLARSHKATSPVTHSSRKAADDYQAAFDRFQADKETQKSSSDRVQVLKGGHVHHICCVDSPDYREAFNTPGLVLRHADGTIEEGVQ